MDAAQKRAASIEAGQEVDLDKVLDLIRAGDSSGEEHFSRIFYPGLRFLLERRLGRTDVEEEALAVVGAAMEEIHADQTLRGHGLPRTVRRLIQERFVPEQRLGDSSKAPEDDPTTRSVEAAGHLLAQLNLVEREALRRCYVLGEKPELILKKLQLNPEQLRAIQSRARAEFSSQVSRTSNVA